MENAQLVQYETKILAIVRENRNSKSRTRVERVYHILRRENGWLKDEIFKLKGMK